MHFYPSGIRLHQALWFLLLTLVVTPTKINTKTSMVQLYRIMNNTSMNNGTGLDRFADVPHTRIRATTCQEIRHFQASASVLRNIKILERCNNSSCWHNDDTQQEYLCSDVAAIYSHLRAIHVASSQAPYAVIMEDSVVFAHGSYMQFSIQLAALLGHAPEGWRIIQLITLHPHLLRQMSSIRDLFVPWLPHSYSSAGYVINRAGMKQLLGQYSAGQHGESLVFRLPDNGVPPFFLLFNSTQTFVATRPLFTLSSSVSGAAGVQEATLAPRRSVQLVPYRSGLKILGCQVASGSPSVLRSHMLATLRVFSKNRFLFAKIGWSYHIQAKGPVSDWDALALEVKRVPGIHVTVDIIQTRVFVNKWLQYNKSVHMMSNYDVVLLMDIDMDLRAFALKEFFARRQTLFATVPIIAGAPRYTATARYMSAPPEAFAPSTWQFWLSRVRGDMLGVPTDFVEQFFGVVHAPFFEWFLGRILTSNTMQKLRELQSAWGPDAVWCGAAKEFAPGNISCAMFPLAIAHLDTKTITKNFGVKIRGQRMLNHFSAVHPKWAQMSARYRSAFKNRNRILPHAPFNELGLPPAYDAMPWIGAISAQEGEGRSGQRQGLQKMTSPMF